jgi:hypothetical protein
MKRLILPVAIIVGANAVVLTLAARERAAPATPATVTVCADLLVGGENDRNRPPALLLTLAPDSAGTTAGLDSAGLRALGFSAQVAEKAGKLRNFDDPWPRQRPAWVRLRQGHDSLHRFQAVEVAARREQLAPDSTSIVVLGIIGLVEHLPDQEPGSGAHEHGGPRPPRVPGILRASVVQVMPRELHLDHALMTDLRRTIPAAPGCGPTMQVVARQGRGGGIWVER